MRSSPPALARTGPLPAVRNIVVLAFDRLSPFHLSVPALVFGEDRQDLGVPRFRLRFCAGEPGRLQCVGGLAVDAAVGLGALQTADLVIVPSWRDVDERPPEAALQALRLAHRRGAVVVGLCLGAFVLAEAGLLDGRRATTHWHWARRFRERFPLVDLQADVLYVDEDRLVTSAGTAAGLDCCLHLLRRICGSEVANRVARRLVVAPHRAGGQAQFMEEPIPRTPADDRIVTALTWAAAHLQEAIGIDTMAQRAAMSRRTFTRRFQQATGSSVLQWLLQQRLAAACRLLESGTQSIEAVSTRAGFGSVASLRQHFQRAYGVSPQTYRRQFRDSHTGPSPGR